MRTPAGHFLAANAVAGDEVELVPMARRRGVRRARVLKVLKPSVDRVAAPCPVAAECGGCALQFLKPERHAALKNDWVRTAFAPFIDEGTEFIPIEAGELHPRRRVTWQIGQDERGLSPGFFAPASHRVVWHDDCIVLTSGLQALHRILRDQPLAGIRQVQATELSDGMHVVLISESEPGLTLPREIEGKWVNPWWRSRERMIPLSRPVKPLHDRLPLAEGDVEIEIGPDGFVQGQFEGNRQLCHQIRQWGGSPRRIVDLFCGAGNLSLPLAAACGAHVTGAELSDASVRMARRNASRLGIDARFEVVNLFEPFDAEPFVGCDLMLLDPPRRGAKRVCRRMGQLLPQRLIMVSCDVAAGARDAGLLAEQGYRLRGLRALDLFSYAGHVEAVSLWEPS